MATPAPFFEKQRAALCGMHAINNLLGEPKLYFSLTGEFGKQRSNTINTIGELDAKKLESETTINIHTFCENYIKPKLLEMYTSEPYYMSEGVARGFIENCKLCGDYSIVQLMKILEYLI